MPMDRAQFAQRLKSNKTVWVAGVYDALSAKLVEAAGFEAAMTSGFGVSASFLGQPDAELYTMSENLAVVRNVASAVKIPVIADIDTGYGNAINVMRTVREFEQAGVAAVILEDQLAPKRCPICVGAVEVLPVEEGIAKIEAAAAARRDKNLVIIARTDVVDEKEAIRRAKLYVAGRRRHRPADQQVLQVDRRPPRAAQAMRRAALSAATRLARARPFAESGRGDRRHGHLRPRAPDDGRTGTAGEPQGARREPFVEESAAAGDGA